MRRKKVLLVDDAKTVILMEQMILNRPDLQLIIAHDGDQAIELALAEKPDLILLDVIMPTLTGIEVLQRLRSEPATKATPIIMVTTRGEEQYIAAAKAAGCTDYVTKPLDAPNLLQKVRTLLHLDA